MIYKFRVKTIKKVTLLFIIIASVVVNIAGFQVKSVLAADMASAVLNIGCNDNIISVNLRMDTNPGIAGMSFKIRYDKDILSVISVDEVPEVFKSAIINPDGDGFIGYAYASAKNCKDTGIVISASLKINEMAQFNPDMIYIDEFDICDSDLVDVKADIKTQIEEEIIQNVQQTDNNMTSSAGNSSERKILSDGEVIEERKTNNSSVDKSNSTDKTNIQNDKELESQDLQTTEKNEINSTNVSAMVIIAVVMAVAIALLFLIKKKQEKTGGVKNEEKK